MSEQAHKPLKERIKGAASWTVTGHVAAQLVKLGSNLMMTYLLVPDDFGLMAVTGVLLVGLTLLSDVGVSQSLISSPNGASPNFRNTVWTLQVVRGFGIWGLACVVAGLFWAIGHFDIAPPDSVYADDRLPLVIIVTFLQSIIQGFTPTKVVMAQRSVSVKEMVLLRLYAQVIALVPMVALAVMYQSVWALVVGGIAAILAQVVLSYTMVPGESDRLSWDKEVLDEIWSYGRWVMLSSVIGFLASCGDRLLLGTYVTASKLGLYSIAILLLAPLQSIYSMLVASVVFPGLSEVYRTRRHDYPGVYARFQKYTDLMSVGGGSMLFVMGPAVVQWLYKSDYHDAGAMLSVLSIGMLGMRFYVIEQCYMASAQTKLMTAANAMRLAALCLFIPLGFHVNGLMGAIWGVALATFAAWPLAIHYRIKQGLQPLKADAWGLPSLLLGTLAGFAGKAVFNHLPSWH